MLIKEITIEDIRNKKYWKVLDSYESLSIHSEIKETKKIDKKDIILHSAVLVEKQKRVYPFLITKYYEDSGEVGEGFIYINDKWRFFDSQVKLEGEIEGIFLSYICTLDIHEYQRGSFDNRKDHYPRFNYYMKQLQSSPIVPYKEKETQISNLTAYLALSAEEKINFLKNKLHEAKDLQESGKVAKGNKIITEYGELLKQTKKDPNNLPFLKAELSGDYIYFTRHIVQELLDIYPEECIEKLKIIAEERSMDGHRAQEILKNLGVPFKWNPLLERKKPFVRICPYCGAWPSKMKECTKCHRTGIFVIQQPSSDE